MQLGTVEPSAMCPSFSVLGAFVLSCPKMGEAWAGLHYTTLIYTVAVASSSFFPSPSSSLRACFCGAVATLDRNVFAERLPGRNHGASIAFSPSWRFQLTSQTHFLCAGFGGWAVFRVLLPFSRFFNVGFLTEHSSLGLCGSWSF